MSILKRIKTLLRLPTGDLAPRLHPPVARYESTGSPRVLLVVYDPIIPSAGNRTLSSVLGWHKVDLLVTEFIDIVERASYGRCRYQIVERINATTFPVKIDGFSYTVDGYLAAWQARRGFHEPDWADYNRILADFDIPNRVQAGQVDEVWLFAFPYGGFYESRMVGAGAFWCNAPPLEGYDTVGRRFVVMGFNYERGVGEMLEAYGHRAESIMGHVFRHLGGDANLWERFTRFEKRNPGRAEVGTVHFAPNSQRDYDWGNREPVLSACDNWYNFPDLSGSPRFVACDEWGNGSVLGHHQWWFSHFPHVDGEADGVSFNWWEYVIDPNQVR